jgi:hypothetical protein
MHGLQDPVWLVRVVAWLSDPNNVLGRCRGCRDEYLAMGLLHITNAVSFLNNDCKLVSTSCNSSLQQANTFLCIGVAYKLVQLPASQIHGNICLDAVVITETLDWKLHGFDLLSEHTLPVCKPQWAVPGYTVQWLRFQAMQSGA